MREINRVIVHCTATRADWWRTRSLKQKIAEIRRWHVEVNGWSDIGYHYLIDRDGKVGKGRPLAKVGAHTRGHNKDSIGIALFGGHGSAETDKIEDHFTLEQEIALYDLILELAREHAPLDVHGHNEFAAKACPGFNVREWISGQSQEAETPAPPAPAPKRPQESVAIAAAGVGIAAAVAGWWDSIVSFFGG